MWAMTFEDPDDRVGALRSFNRFYTRRIGVLAGMHRTAHELPQARVLYELGRAGESDVGELRRELGIDGGQLSRVLAGLEGEGLLTRGPSPTDGRRRGVRLTAAGEAARALLDERSAADNRRLLAQLPERDQQDLLEAMATIRSLLGEDHGATAVEVRSAGPGELGWIVSRHGALYREEYAWDQRMEGLTAQVIADFAKANDPAREAVWIATAGGRRAGSIMCVDRGEGVAQLRLLLVEPSARGLGVGSRLVDECLEFARAAGYREIVLWTNSVLHGARRIYERAGFELVREEREDWPDPVFQTWSRRL
jgi:DNA-binding MarR family transcriptional regulator/GNAT superfamily N-acetyltransferase